MKLLRLLTGLISIALSAACWAQSQGSGEGNQNNGQQAVDTSSLPALTEGPGTHDGSDVDALGNRHFACNLAGKWFTPERQVSIGRSVAQQIESRVKLVNDPAINEYVNHIGQNLARNSNALVPFTFKIIDSSAVNALALPNGFVYINSGLILAAGEEAELAGLLAHEIAHVAVCHAGRTWSSAERGPEDPWNPIILADGGIDNAAGMLGIARFVRGFEGEADYLGIQYMYRAGYDPSALVLYFEKIEGMQRPPWRPGAVAKAFVTHMQNEHRIQQSQEEIEAIPAADSEYVVTNSEFNNIKAQLAAESSNPEASRRLQLSMTGK